MAQPTTGAMLTACPRVPPTAPMTCNNSSADCFSVSFWSRPSAPLVTIWTSPFTEGSEAYSMLTL